jgi:hypothetical protein
MPLRARFATTTTKGLRQRRPVPVELAMSRMTWWWKRRSTPCELPPTNGAVRATIHQQRIILLRQFMLNATIAIACLKKCIFPVMD